MGSSQSCHNQKPSCHSSQSCHDSGSSCHSSNQNVPEPVYPCETPCNPPAQTYHEPTQYYSPPAQTSYPQSTAYKHPQCPKF
uniref:Epidermal differentiation protein n=1 Tax=Coturnix japonica TaxID=93934 RepID=A0A8C2TUH5_COTJA